MGVGGRWSKLLGRIARGRKASPAIPALALKCRQSRAEPGFRAWVCECGAPLPKEKARVLGPASAHISSACLTVTGGPV